MVRLCCSHSFIINVSFKYYKNYHTIKLSNISSSFTIKFYCCRNRINYRFYLPPKTLFLCCLNRRCMLSLFCRIIPQLSRSFIIENRILQLNHLLPLLHLYCMNRIESRRRTRSMIISINPSGKCELVCLSDNPRVVVDLFLYLLLSRGYSLWCQ